MNIECTGGPVVFMRWKMPCLAARLLSEFRSEDFGKLVMEKTIAIVCFHRAVVDEA